MSDLVSYSIMMNGDKAISHTLPFAPLTMGKVERVTLPPINCVRLTETNLNLLNAYHPALSAPLLTSLLSALELPLLSPQMGNAELYDATPQPHAAKKRRQRLGPLCDNCRARKVKCNAEVLLLTRQFDTEGAHIDEYATLPAEQQAHAQAGALVRIAGNFVLVLSHNKLIKFRPCLLCAGKGLGCCFSKGFTKEDIVHSKRLGDATPVVERAAPAKVVKKRAESMGPLTRKSSCSHCRKRKVKCVMNARANRCVGCIKKDSECTFEAC